MEENIDVLDCDHVVKDRERAKRIVRRSRNLADLIDDS